MLKPSTLSPTVPSALTLLGPGGLRRSAAEWRA